MPSTTTMTWNAKQRRWFKKLNNKQYAVSCRELRRLFPDLVTTNTKEGTKKAANKWWEQERLRIETENIPKPWQEKHDPHSYHIDIHQRRKAWYELVEEKSGVAWEQGLIDAIQNARKNKTALSEVLGAEADMQVLRAEEEQWADKYRALDRTADEGRNHRSLEYSVTKLIDQYVEAKRITAMSRQISPGRVENIRIELSRFATWYSGNDARQISGQVLMDFHGHLLTSISDKMVSAYHARDTMATVFRFVKWLWKREVIADLPRVDSSDLRIVVQPGEVHPFADSEVKYLLSKVEGKQKLYYLLMLNCGMTQVDVANLRKDEVDWKAGRIRRKRSKTRNNNGVPEVNYKLWDETFQLLCTHQTQDHPELVLTTAKGDSLHATETKTSGKGRLYKRDVIGRQYARLRDRLKRPLRPLKSLRKTSATKLDKNAEYARYTQHFLGHSPRSVADRHYKKPDGEQFDQTVKWLGEQFGFPTTR